MSENEKLVMVSVLCFTIGLVGALVPQYNRDQEVNKLIERIEKVEKHGIYICKGCGAEYYTDGFVKYHDECPQCPVTEEQLDEWIKKFEHEQNKRKFP